MHYKYIPCLLMHVYADHRDNARAYSSLSYNEIKINIVLNNDAISQINLIRGSSSMIYVLVALYIIWKGTDVKIVRSLITGTVPQQCKICMVVTFRIINY